ncbi:DNA-binding protein [Gordonibacter sp. Marseille-P4307]|uniref:Fic family protein n=1 Tax=Gordonibacter sp. Marseille-P4307 TaxID=2161815 RepID=UPI000F524B34|nr:DNA-binding protein [Gordonibacter sp. Marseille-P4307]
MSFLSASEIAAIWGVSERSVRNYCAQGRVPGAFLTGKTWNIPDDAEKPARANAKASIEPNALLARLLEEKRAGVHGGIYHKLQIELTYNSNHMEGSRLSMDQTRFIFETSTIGFEGESIKVDDVIEAANHFHCIDCVLENAQKPLSERLIKELHRTLKDGTSDSRLPWFAVGDYKTLPNEVANMTTTRPEGVAGEIGELLREYDPKAAHTLEQIIELHVKFERIHPFQDGNGRVGRLIMLKECLASNVVPFVIADSMKAYYYRGLSEWNQERGYLTETCLAAQDRFKTWMDYFRIPHGE